MTKIAERLLDQPCNIGADGNVTHADKTVAPRSPTSIRDRPELCLRPRHQEQISPFPGKGEADRLPNPPPTAGDEPRPSGKPAAHRPTPAYSNPAATRLCAGRKFRLSMIFGVFMMARHSASSVVVMPGHGAINTSRLAPRAADARSAHIVNAGRASSWPRARGSKARTSAPPASRRSISSMAAERRSVDVPD